MILDGRVMRYESHYRRGKLVLVCVEDGAAGDTEQRPEINILAIALLIILVLLRTGLFNIQSRRNSRCQNKILPMQGRKRLYQGQLKTLFYLRPIL